LEDTKDAVYVFLAIGVGIASGVQALGLAFVLSLIFNAVVLVLWKTRFGNPYAVRGVGPGGIGLAEAMGGLGGEPTRIVGSDALVAAAGPADLRAVLERATSMERHISEERGRRRKERANALLVVHAAAAGPAQSAVEPVLEDVATRWKLGEIVPVGPAHVALAYLARLDAPGAEGALLDRVLTLGDAGIRAAEMRSLKGLSKRS
ncbi:MAG TPA: hypothetical protein VK849_10135, partial [Longimicrobiales bacterium]|nr:hypothetical protein [Longimicrobiales bacterium]